VLTKVLHLPKLMLTGAEDKALQGCILSADFRGQTRRAVKPPLVMHLATWDGSKALKSRRSGGRASS
jgi:hypothetical protein